MRARPYHLALGLVTVVAAAARVLLRSPALETFDSVGFAAALSNYDLVERTPHFPGYAVYIALARLFSWLGADDVTALELPGAVGAVLVTTSLASIARAVHSERAGIAAALLALVLPGLHLAAARPLSEGLGIGFLALGAALVVKTWRAPSARTALLAGVVLGLLLGIRLAWLGVVVGLLLPFAFSRRAQLRPLVSGLGAGVVMWAVPMLVLLGPAHLCEAAERMLVGHFTVWGGTVASEGLPVARFTGHAWNVFVHALGFYGPDDAATPARACWSLIVVLSVVAWRARLAGTLPLLASVVAAAINLVMEANPDNARHATQLVVLLVPFLAVALARLPGLAPIAALVGGLAVLPVVLAQGVQPPPSVDVGRFAAAMDGGPRVRLYAWTTMRVVRAMHPALDVRLVGSVAEMVDDLRAQPPPPGTRVLFESRLQGKRRREFDFTPLVTFSRSRLVDPAGAAITVYRFDGMRE